MQGQRNKQLDPDEIKSARYLGSFENCIPLDFALTSHCLDPTVAMACV
jgi:hypothetical protein